MIKEQFFDSQAAQLAQLAETKNYDAVCDAAIIFFEDGSLGDAITAIGQALEAGQQFQPNTPIWQLFVEETACFFVGSFANVKAQIEALP